MLWRLLFVAMAALSAVVIWRVEPFVLSLVLLMTLVWLWTPAVLAVAIYAIVVLCKGKDRYYLTRIALGLGIYLVFAISAMSLNQTLYNHQIEKVKAYFESHLPKLEAYRTAHGHYPDSLAALTLPAPPRLFKTTRYRAIDGGYDFIVPVSGMAPDFWIYSSAAPFWHFES